MTSMRHPFVEVRGVVLNYRDTMALDRVDLELNAGETLVLLGPNGAGKTSLMRLISGRIAPTEGSVRVAGGNPAEDQSTRRLIGWVPQEIALYPRLTVRENLDIFGQLAGLSRGDRRAALPQILAATGIGDIVDRVVGTLSSGYRRRVNIAASLLHGPKLILLDEPTQGVDLDARAAIHTVLDTLRRAGAAILLSTHDFGEAERLADRVTIMSSGRVLKRGATTDLLRAYVNAPPEYEAFLDGVPERDGEITLGVHGFASTGKGNVWRAGHVPSGLDAAALLSALRGGKVAVAELRLRRPGLETLYRDTLASASPPPKERETAETFT